MLVSDVTHDLNNYLPNLITMFVYWNCCSWS